MAGKGGLIMKYIPTCFTPSVCLAALVWLLSACGGGETTSTAVTQTMTKQVEGASCGGPILGDTTIVAADLQAIRQAGLVPEKIYCQRNLHIASGDLCGGNAYWFDIFIEVPPSQVEQAQALGYSKFTPPADADYVDFACLP
jgi:hypothetical protein